MSRIGRLPIQIPQGVSVKFENGIVTVSGPKGELRQTIADKHIDVKIDANQIVVSRNNDENETKAKHGLYRQLINNMVKGVSNPFVKTLKINGVGWRCQVNGDKLTLNIGFSHTVEVVAPKGITFACPDANTITVTGIDKDLVGQTAANIKAKRPVEPYHGYGIMYSDEVVIRKAGKTGGK